MSNREIPVWLERLAAKVGSQRDWSSNCWQQADEAIRKMGSDLFVDDEVTDLIGLLIEEIERLKETIQHDGCTTSNSRTDR